MMTQGQQLRQLFALTYGVIRENLESVEHEESLAKSGMAGNCVNWLVGHILQNRDRMLELLKTETVWSNAESARYARGAPPLEPGESAVRLEKMLGLFETSQQRLLAGLEVDGALLSEVGNRTLGDELFTFNFHESYHAGQLGLARRMIGKRGAIP